MEMIINKEKCLPIVGFERYHVSETGRVYRTDLEKKDLGEQRAKYILMNLKFVLKLEIIKCVRHM